MDYYTVISSDLYSLSCVAVSQLEDMVQDELKSQDIFLVSEKISSDDPTLSTRTGYMSKFVSTQHLKDALARMLDYNRVSSDVSQMSAIYAKKEDLKTGNLSVDNMPNPYIISSMVFKDGVPSCLYGYRLLDVLKDTIICVDYERLSVMNLSSQTFVSPTASVSTLNVTNISNDFIQHMEDVVPDGASNENKLADISTMMSAILEYAPTFRGNLENWSQAEHVENYLEDEQGNRTPNRNDYMVLSAASTYPNITPRLQDTWRFRYVGNWDEVGENGWEPEYKIEIPPFTEKQKLALNSEITFDTKVTHDQNQKVGDGETKLIFIDTDGKAKPGVDFTKNIPLATSNSVGGMKLYSNDDMDTMGDNNYPVQLDTSQTVHSGKAYVHVPIVTPLSGAGIQYDDDGTIRINPNNIETWTFTLRDEHDNETTITRRFVVVNESCLIQVEVGSGIGQVSAVPGDMSSIVLYGDSIEISAFPGFGQKFVGWKSDSSQGYESTSATYEFEAVRDKNLTGDFEEYTDNPMTQVRFVDQNFENYDFSGTVTKGNLFTAQPALRPDESETPTTAGWNLVPIETVNFGKTVTSLGPSLFRNCPTLKSVSIQEGVGSIEYRVFSDCSNLSSVSIPLSLSSLGNAAFATCRRLSSVDNLDNIKNVGTYAFQKTSLTSISIPEVSSIGEFAFRECTHLSSIYMPKVKQIGNNAFETCTSLSSISIPDEITSLGLSVFSKCTNLSIPLEQTQITSIGEWAFNGCGFIELSVTGNIKEIKKSAFMECLQLSSIYIGPQLSSLADYSFYGCANLETVILPDKGITVSRLPEMHIFENRKAGCKFHIYRKDPDQESDETETWLKTYDHISDDDIVYI